ncbi:MAG TPA: hypothetical protein VFM25_12115 [Verrucomicrobiae bacterium]|nr:hypothetical protein [Verrucomicrobiae bacterium]
MKLTKRSYPHPVVGNRDDVPGAAFQAAVEMSSDTEKIYIDVSAKCSSSTVNQLLSQGMATHVIHIECSNTLYRRAFEFAESSKRISVPAENLNDAVEVNVFVRALRDEAGYSVEAAHPDYDGAKFQIRAGDILAVGEGYVFHIESSFDSLSRIGSIMQIEEAREDGDMPMRVDFNGEKILIILSKADFKDYKLLKAQEGVSAALTTTIVLPVLVEALHVWKSDEAGAREDNLRWMRALRNRIAKLELESESDNLILAQKLLELPLRRALVASRQLAEATS